MSSRDPEITPSKSHCKKPKDEGPTEEHNSRNAPSNKSEHAEPSSNTTEFSKLMVCVCLHGLVETQLS